MSKRAINRTPMPEQDAKQRVGNFDEVTLGYTPEHAAVEASRCLQCPTRPCMEGCPVHVAIPHFISHITKGDLKQAYEAILSTNNLPAVCGRVCPQETQCEQRCVLAKAGRPIAIGALERFVADTQGATAGQVLTAKNEKSAYGYSSAGPQEEQPNASHQKKVAVVGSGPAGLTCAADLAKLGYRVTVFEALHELGGVLTYGIPEFRLPKAIVKREVEQLRDLGVELKTNMVIGSVMDLDDLKQEGYEAVFLGSGAGLPNFLGIPGENLNGVYSANEFLTRVNLMKAGRAGDTPIWIGQHVAVIGGGNVAMDSARTARRLGAEVSIIYRRSQAELPARHEEVEHALAEGVQFALLNNPISITAKDGWVAGVQCVRMELGEPDASGRRRPMTVPGSEHEVAADTVVVAIGQSPNPLLLKSIPGLEVSRHGHLVVDEGTGATNIPGIFAGGDLTTGAASVIAAMGAGKRAAAAMDRYLQGNRGQSQPLGPDTHKN